MKGCCIRRPFLNTMKRNITLLSVFLFLALLLSCSTTAAVAERTYEWGEFNSSVPDSIQYGELFREYNKYNGRIAVGISGPYVNKRNAIEAATLNCVQMLSFYRGLAMETESGVVIDTNRYRNNFDTLTYGGTSDDIYESTAEDMEIVDVIWFGGDIGAAVFATLPEMKEIKWNGSWENPESYDDTVFVAVECSFNRYAKYKNAIEASVFRAAAKLMNSDRGSLNVNATLVETTESSYENQSFSISGSKLTGFTVLQLRYDDESDKVYALVAAKKRGV